MMNRTLIGISGKMGAGKDTLAALMHYHIGKHAVEKGLISPTLFPSLERFIEGAPIPSRDGWETRRYADKLKECVALILGVPRHKFEDQEFKKENMPVEWNRNSSDYGPTGSKKMTYRQMLQEFGTEVGRSIHPNFWVNALFSDFKEGDKWIITDVRFPNEADRIARLAGINIQVIRTIDREVGASHSSETSMDSYTGFHYTVMNNGTIEELSIQAKSILIQEKIISNVTIENSEKKESTG